MAIFGDMIEQISGQMVAQQRRLDAEHLKAMREYEALLRHISASPFLDVASQLAPEWMVALKAEFEIGLMQNETRASGGFSFCATSPGAARKYQYSRTKAAQLQISVTRNPLPPGQSIAEPAVTEPEKGM